MLGQIEGLLRGAFSAIIFKRLGGRCGVD